MYGMIALFDEQTEKRIREVWEGLKREGITSYAFEVSDRQPHITLASYNRLDVEAYIGLLDTHYQSKEVVHLTFSTVGTFIQSGALFLSPTISSGLRGLHSEHHRVFGSFNDNVESLYLPESWIPHCTLANRLSKKEMKDAFEYCTDTVKPLSGKVVEVALIELVTPSDVRVVHSVSLSEKST
ncbi:2'-5' RNA ligase family protein [Exiguobacterium sp. SL-10]|uniref:2'-5' RNA ligase family protein n=1 Tax=Exiguobacterium sp. SL-10 TaxID=2510962 RepID=UPI001038669F|nr:2'-5' RNA ligase family protein [Exiguobacterium sp. SL-10]TCI29103.1 2'-5' RNA ligase family protein [Exiguobacterium sp. SL-10]